MRAGDAVGTMMFPPEDHAANAPDTWVVVKAMERLWQLKTKDGDVIQSFPTKTRALQARNAGFYPNLYEKEGRWYAGEKIPGWKEYSEVVAR